MKILNLKKNKYIHFKNIYSKLSRDFEKKYEMSKFIIKVLFIY
jgi:hypothetical protein